MPSPGYLPRCRIAMRHSLPSFALIFLLVSTVQSGCAPLEGSSPSELESFAEHVVVIGIDGLSPDGIQQAETPHFDQLINTGAHTFRARAVMPTSSSPNWGSMMMGAGPEQHGVLSNDWGVDNIELEPVCKDETGRYPSIFGVLRKAMPDAKMAAIHDWGGFGRLVNPEYPDLIQDGDGPDQTVELALSFIAEHAPLFTFVHLDHVDHAGHQDGHGTPEYYASVVEADRMVGDLLEGIKEAGILENTVVIVTSDHGGVGKGHGGSSLAEMEIPWIVSGAGVKAGYVIDEPVDTYDTAATVAYALGVSSHPCWIAQPVDSAFEAGGM